MNLWGKLGRLSALARNLHLLLLHCSVASSWRSQSRTSLSSQTPVSASLASQTRAATFVTKTHIQLTESICTLAISVLAGASSLSTLAMSTQDTTCLLGPAIVTRLLLQRAKTNLPKGSRQRNRWQPCFSPSASHSVIDLEMVTEESAGPLTLSGLLKTIQDYEDTSGICRSRGLGSA